jgi:urate oxidase
VQHYDVLTRLFSPGTSDVYTREDNAMCVATDTQRNTVYLVAKRSKVNSPPCFTLKIPRGRLGTRTRIF